MNLMLRLLPGFVGLTVAYIVGLYLMRLDVVLRFTLGGASIFLLSILFNKYNIWMMIREGKISNKEDLMPKNLGHVFNIVGSVLIGYILVERNVIIGCAGIICLMYADTLLTKTKKKNVQKNGKEKKVNNREQQLEAYIKKESENDPFIALKVGSTEIERKIAEILKIQKKFKPEVLVCAVGALAGYSCHNAIREALIETGKAEESQVFVRIDGKDGNIYYYGDAINKFLVEEPLSILASVNKTMEDLNVKEPPKIEPILEYVTSNVGGKTFGEIQIKNANVAELMPIDLVRLLWKKLIPEFEKYCTSPVEKPALMAKMVSNIIHKNKDVLCPEVAAQIVLQSAAATSKIGPEWL